MTYFILTLFALYLLAFAWVCVEVYRAPLIEGMDEDEWRQACEAEANERCAGN